MPFEKPASKPSSLASSFVTRGPPQARITLLAQSLRLDHLDELGEVLDVEVLLGDGLRDEDRVGADLDRARHERAVGHLTAEVVGANARTPRGRDGRDSPSG